MRCNTFQQRMQLLLDQRASLQDDLDLRRHADRCVDCRSQLEVWEAIESSLAPPSATISRDSVANRIPIYAAAALAASLLFVLTFFAGKQFETSRLIPSIAQVDAAIEPVSLEPIDKPAQPPVANAELSPEAIQWWQSMGQREWFADSIPAMKSFDEGVAPLRRSIIQVVQILTFGDVYQTS